jgi:hypothetical protein
MERADPSILKKRLSTFRTSKGVLREVSDELLVDILRTWESWPGSSKEFYQSIGASKTQMAVLMGKAKKLSREGHYPAEEFKEIQVEAGSSTFSGSSLGIELMWEGKVLRFSQVEQLVEFLKKVAA